MKRSRVLTLTILVALCALVLGGGFPAGPAFAQAVSPGAPAMAASAPASADAVQAALGAAFTYQGNLKKNGQPANTTCSFQFSLWDAASGGAQRGSTVPLSNVAVVAGLFTVELNFGNQFNGDARWLQTEVQCAGDGGFTTLAPRQALNAVPYAIGLRPGAVMQSASSGDAFYVEKTATNSIAIHGKATQTGATGVLGESASWAGVWGESTSASGVVGRSAGQFSGGVYGENTGQGWGVYGKAVNGAGVFGESPAWFGVYGKSTSQAGVVGDSINGDGVRGLTTSGKSGVYGQTDSTAANSTGVWGRSDAAGTFGVYGSSVAGQAIRGVSTTGPGVVGTSTSGDGVRGLTTTGKSGVYGQNDNTAPYSVGVWGRSDSTNTFGVYGSSAAGIGTWGQSTTGYGVVGVSTSGDGVRGQSTTGFAGYFIGKVGITGGADLAERFDVTATAPVEPGTLLIIDDANPGKLKVSDAIYDTRVAGIVSGAGGVKPGLTLYQEGVMEGATEVAIAGRVYVKAEANSGPIQPGDLLTTSDLPGHAMKATDRERAYGAVIGKAMTGLESGTGLVLVLVNLQ